ncbi:MAG: UPF0175 family protein [Gammaproteobacteria bacterium]
MRTSLPVRLRSSLLVHQCPGKNSTHNGPNPAGKQISIGVASRIAGLSINEMIDELGRRRIPVVRYSEEELAEEMKYVRGLTGRR